MGHVGLSLIKACFTVGIAGKRGLNQGFANSKKKFVVSRLQLYHFNDNYREQMPAFNENFSQSITERLLFQKTDVQIIKSGPRI
jgi:hypothetical protein